MSYIKDALRTESIVGANERLDSVFSKLSKLNLILTDDVEVFADELKKYVYYGKKPTSFKVRDTKLPLVEPVNLSDEKLRLLHAGLGMLTEAQEFLKPVLNSIIENKDLDKVNLKEELGDLLWYEAIACDTLNTTFKIEQNRNIAKLKSRYPDKFSSDKAIHRDIKTERKILEND